MADTNEIENYIANAVPSNFTPMSDEELNQLKNSAPSTYPKTLSRTAEALNKLGAGTPYKAVEY